MINTDYDTITTDVGLTVSITPLQWKFYIEGWRDSPLTFCRLRLGPIYIAVER